MTNRMNWCFTWNHPTELIDWSIYKQAKDPSKDLVKYAIYQHEIGEEGTDHFQGYVEFTTSVRFERLKEMIAPEIHWEPRRETRIQAIEYCRKEKSRILGPWEYGDPVAHQGRRNDLRRLNDAVKAQMPLKEIKDQFPDEFYKFQRGIDRARLLEMPERHFKTFVTLIYGPTGTGKSKFVEASCPTAYWKPPANHWWDNYQSDYHVEVILDDYNYPWFKFDYLLRLLDRYPFQVEFKGGMTQLLAKKIIITTNKLPTDWYGKKCRPHMPALLRRIDEYCIIPSFGAPPQYYMDAPSFFKAVKEMPPPPPVEELPTGMEIDDDGYEKYPKLYSEDD